MKSKIRKRSKSKRKSKRRMAIVWRDGLSGRDFFFLLVKGHGELECVAVGVAAPPAAWNPANASGQYD